MTRGGVGAFCRGAGWLALQWVLEHDVLPKKGRRSTATWDRCTEGGRRQQDEASSHPATGWQSPLPGRKTNPTLQTGEHAPPWSFSHGAPLDGVYGETAATAHCYFRNLQRPRWHPKTPVLQHTDAMNRHAPAPGILHKEIQNTKTLPQALCAIEQDVTRQLQPETTAKVASPVSWAKSSYWAGSQKQGSTLERPARSLTACSRRWLSP